jgi:hypothetical protein
MDEALRIGLFLFGFFTGLWLGYRTKRGQLPRTPVRVLKDAIENKKAEQAEQEAADEIQMLADFDGFTPKEKAQMRGKND